MERAQHLLLRRRSCLVSATTTVLRTQSTAPAGLWDIYIFGSETWEDVYVVAQQSQAGCRSFLFKE